MNASEVDSSELRAKSGITSRLWNETEHEGRGCVPGVQGPNTRRSERGKKYAGIRHIFFQNSNMPGPGIFLKLKIRLTNGTSRSMTISNMRSVTEQLAL